MNFKEYALGTAYETHTLKAGYFTAEIRKGRHDVYYITCADTCPYEIARINLPKEAITAKSLAEAKYKVAQIFQGFTRANSQTQAELSVLWQQIAKGA